MPIVQNSKASEKHYRRIEEYAPKTGTVRLLRLTEKQYNNIYLVTGEPDYQKYVDMVTAGILDPAKVTRSALQNATSVASTLLTTESVVANIKEDVPTMPAGGGMGGMM